MKTAGISDDGLLVVVILLLVLAFNGEPDLWDALISHLYRPQTCVAEGL